MEQRKELFAVHAIGAKTEWLSWCPLRSMECAPGSPAEISLNRKTFAILADAADLELYVWQCIRLHPARQLQLNTPQGRLSKHDKAMMATKERDLDSRAKVSEQRSGIFTP